MIILSQCLNKEEVSMVLIGKLFRSKLVRSLSLNISLSSSGIKGFLSPKAIRFSFVEDELIFAPIIKTIMF